MEQGGYALRRPVWQAPARPRNLDHDGYEVFGAIQLEVVNLHCDGQVRDGIGQHQGILKLTLFIGWRDCLNGLPA
jgi:hypothetical protein